MICAHTARYAGPSVTNSTLIDVGGVVLEVMRWPGDAGAPILMLHEGLGSASMWRDFPTRLASATGREVIAWSRQGYGQSDRLPRKRDPDYMHIEAARAIETMDGLGLTRAHLFGHSDGASIALIMAAGRADRVASLVLEAPHVFVEQLTYDSIANVAATYAASGLGARLARYHADADHAFERWRDIWLDPRFRAWTIEDLLPRVTAPTLLIQGRDDEYGTMAQLDRIETAVGGARRLELDQCGHSPHRDQAGAVLAATAAFLRDLG